MIVLDYIIITCAVVSLLLGLIKGFLKPIFNLAGFFVVLYAGGAFSSILFPLLANIIPDEGTCSIASAVASMLLVWLIYFLISSFILKLISKIKILGAANRISGGVLGLAMVYIVVAVVTAFMQNDSALFASLREQHAEAFNQSWIVQNIYASNPIGEGLVNSAFQELIRLLEESLIPQAIV